MVDKLDHIVASRYQHLKMFGACNHKNVSK